MLSGKGSIPGTTRHPFPPVPPLPIRCEAWLSLVLPPRGQHKTLLPPSEGAAPPAAVFSFHLQPLVSGLSFVGTSSVKTRQEERASPNEAENNCVCASVQK